MPRKRIDRLISKVVTMNGDEKNFYLTPSGDELVIGAGQESDINDTYTRILTVNSTSGSLSGSFTGSFSGDGTGITGVTGEWDGSHTGNASITGSLYVTQAISGSEITGSSISGSLIQATQITGSDIYVSGRMGIGANVPQVPLDISEMGGLVIAQRNVFDASSATNNIALPSSMAKLSDNFSVTFTVPSNGKVSIQISAFFAHAGAPGVTARTAQVAIHDGSGYVYDVDGVQLDSQEFWQSEGENYMQSMEFVVTKDSSNVDLVPGASHTFNAYFQASASSTIYIYYGANYLPFIMKAVTVPNTIL